jgi:hypothetical protein
LAAPTSDKAPIDIPLGFFTNSPAVYSTYSFAIGSPAATNGPLYMVPKNSPQTTAPALLTYQIVTYTLAPPHLLISSASFSTFGIPAISFGFAVICALLLTV